jgi:hypothetical protein
MQYNTWGRDDVFVHFFVRREDVPHPPPLKLVVEAGAADALQLVAEQFHSIL